MQRYMYHEWLKNQSLGLRLLNYFFQESLIRVFQAGFNAEWRYIEDARPGDFLWCGPNFVILEEIGVYGDGSTKFLTRNVHTYGEIWGSPYNFTLATREEIHQRRSFIRQFEQRKDLYNA